MLCLITKLLRKIFFASRTPRFPIHSAVFAADNAQVFRHAQTNQKTAPPPDCIRRKCGWCVPVRVGAYCALADGEALGDSEASPDALGNGSSGKVTTMFSLSRSAVMNSWVSVLEMIVFK